MGDVMLTREAKARLFDEDFMWLEKQSRTLECGHLMDTVKWVAAEIRAGHDPFEYWKARCEQAERERDDLKDEWDKLLYINGVLKILGDSGLTPEQSVVELGKRLKDAESERDELRTTLAHAVYRDHDHSNSCSGCQDIDRLIGKGE